MDKLNAPAIQYLKTFVVASHFLSFKLAADELHLTPSAISQQIKSLENQLETALFNREQKPLILTPAGIRFLKLAKKTIEDYESGFREFIQSEKNTPFHLSATAYLANHVLIPNLNDFHEANPDIKLALHASDRYEDLIEAKFDAAIRFSFKPDGASQLISKVELLLVCSQDYFDKNKLYNALNWHDIVLIHCRNSHDDWFRYLHSNFGINRQEYNLLNHQFFDSYEASIHAAKLGVGIAFAVIPSSNKELALKELVKIAQTEINESLYFIQNTTRNKSRECVVIYNWLLALLANSSLT